MQILYKVAFFLVIVIHLSSGCSNYEFKCNNGECIRSTYRCDTDRDCVDGSDEEGCSETTCEDDEFRCSSGKCIPKHYMCDEDNDCSLGEDEDYGLCQNKTIVTHRPETKNSSSLEEITDDIIVPSTSSSTCDEGKFRCRNGNCVTGSYRCDGDRDCTDGSDEDQCNHCLKPSSIECTVIFRKGGVRDFNSWKCVENNTFRISPGRLIPRTHGSFDDPTVAYIKINCEASFQIDFDFKGVDALEIFDVSRSRKDSKHVLSVQSVLAPHTTGRYTFMDRNNSSRVNEFFIYVEKETKPFLLGRHRNLHLVWDQGESIFFPCISSKLNVPVYLFRKENNGTYTRMENDSSVDYQYDPKRGFAISPDKLIEVYYLDDEWHSVDNKTIEFICTTDPRNSNDIDIAHIQIPFIIKNNEEHNISISNETYNTDLEPGLKIVFDPKGRSGATCHSVPYNSNISIGTPLKFTNLYAKNPIEAKLLIDCVSKGLQSCGTKQRIQQHNPPTDYVTCKYGSRMSNCHHLSEIYDQGVLICQSGTDVISKTYFIGLDRIPYSDNEWDTVPDSAILRVEANFKSDEIISETDYHVKCPGIDMILDRNPTIEIAYIDNTTQKKTTYSSSAYVSLKVGATDISCIDSVWKSNKIINATLHLNTTVKPKPCSYLQFSCANGHCIRYSYRCDRDNDCTDGSDEVNCTYSTTTTTTVAPCSATEFKCNSGVCIRASYRCDGDNDCRYGEDEEDCPTTTTTPRTTSPAGPCSPGQFACKNSDCIRILYMCDNEKDCKDGSDEDVLLCGNRTTTTIRSFTIPPTITSISNITNVTSTTTPTSTTTERLFIYVDKDHTEIYPEIIVRQHRINGKEEVSNPTSGGAIAGIIVGVLIAILLIVGLIFAYYKYLTGPRRGNYSGGTNIKYTNPMFDSDNAVTVT